MAVVNLERTSVTTDVHTKSVSRRGAYNLMISRCTSSPAGIDWRMIRSTRENIRREKVSG